MRHAKILSVGIVLVLLISGFRYQAGSGFPDASIVASIDADTVTLFDSARNRRIPVALYRPAKSKSPSRTKLVIFNHGYGQNAAGTFLNYSYLNKHLAANGYLVVSIQHELETDSLIPSAGIPRVVRRPFWESGVANIRFVIAYLNKEYANIDPDHITLIGHSNGGDIAALYIEKYPGTIDKIITLDNRRMPLPATRKKPKVYSLRSSDQPADEGVLPTTEMQNQLGMRIINLPNTIHNDMDDRGTARQKTEINSYILRFMRE